MAKKFDWEVRLRPITAFDDVPVGTARIVTFPGMPGWPDREIIFTRARFAWSARFAENASIPISTPRGAPYKEVVRHVRAYFKKYDNEHKKDWR